MNTNIPSPRPSPRGKKGLIALLGTLLVYGAAALLAAGADVTTLPDAPPFDMPARAPTWKPPAATDVKSQALAWLEKRKAGEGVRAKAAALWANLPEGTCGDDLLNRLTATIALDDPEAAKLVDLCSKPRSQLKLPSQTWLQDAKLPPFVAANFRLLYGRWLVQQSLYDEALEQLAGLNPGDVVAPAELLFYQGVVYYRLLNQERGLKAIDDLLDGAEASPRRYVAVARLMQVDLGALRPDTLDHIARRMENIGQQLELGRGGAKVRKVQDGVIESLDKLIKQLEEEQQQCQGGGNQFRPARPADRSQLKGSRGTGEVVKKKYGNKGEWGDLPPKEREEAVQQIGRDFPSHYRDAIEQYFRRLAAEEDNKEKR
jgi:hypothetical protein